MSRLTSGIILFVLEYKTNKPLESWEIIGTPEYEDIDMKDGEAVYTARLKHHREYVEDG